jgi:hypothetical protein
VVLARFTTKGTKGVVDFEMNADACPRSRTSVRAGPVDPARFCMASPRTARGGTADEV